MNRLRPHDFEACETAFSREPGQEPVAGLLITCTAECFPTEVLSRELVPGAWLIHRTPGNIVPPFGAGHHLEEDLLEHAIQELRLGTLVVCGHHPCEVVAHLVASEPASEDLLLREWLSHAETARRCLLGLVEPDPHRAAAVHNVLAQLANLRTHPAVAAALARGQLNLWGWLHTGELLCPGSQPTSFDRLVALSPEQNRQSPSAPQARATRPALLAALPPSALPGLNSEG